MKKKDVNFKRKISKEIRELLHLPGVLVPLSAKKQDIVRKHANIMSRLAPYVANSNLTSKFTTIGNTLRNQGKYGEFAHLLNRRSQKTNKISSHV